MFILPHLEHCFLRSLCLVSVWTFVVISLFTSGQKIRPPPLLPVVSLCSLPSYGQSLHSQFSVGSFSTDLAIDGSPLSMALFREFISVTSFLR
jgi:hypothetical protein